MSTNASDRGFVGRRPTRRPKPNPMTFLEDLNAPPWMSEGLCAQTDPESFFPEKGGSTREAKKTCQTCPVITQCLDYALANQERFGIWGGMSERERRKILRPAGEPRICALPDCGDPIPAHRHGSAKYCTREHGLLANQLRISNQKGISA